MKVLHKKFVLFIVSIMVVLGSLGFIIVMVNPFSEKYILSVRVDVITTHWNSIYQNGVMIVFLQNNNTVKECFVSCGHWENISISKGSYVLRVYEGKSGVFIKEYSIYIVKDTELNIKI